MENRGVDNGFVTLLTLLPVGSGMRDIHDVAAVGRTESIQESYDYCEGESAFIIADTATDDAWVAISRGDEAAVEEWR